MNTWKHINVVRNDMEFNFFNLFIMINSQSTKKKVTEINTKGFGQTLSESFKMGVQKLERNTFLFFCCHWLEKTKTQKVFLRKNGSPNSTCISWRPNHQQSVDATLRVHLQRWNILDQGVKNILLQTFTFWIKIIFHQWQWLNLNFSSEISVT